MRSSSVRGALGLLGLATIGAAGCGGGDDDGGDGGGLAAWAARLGGSGSDGAFAVAVGPDSEAAVGGFFSGQIMVGDRELTAVGGWDAFVVCLEADGGIRWARGLGGPSQDFARGLAFFPDGDLLVAGEFVDKIDAAPAPLESAGGTDGFAARLAGDDGTVRWLVALGGTDEDRIAAAAVTPDGDALVAGELRGQVAVGETRLTSAGAGDGMIALLDGSDGTPRWAIDLGGPAEDSVTAVAATPDGGAVAALSFTEVIRVGAEQQVGHSQLTDGLVVAVDAAGAPRWSMVVGGQDDDSLHGIAVDAAGRVLVTGELRGDAEVGDRALAGAASGSFAAGLSADGDLAWATRIDGTGYTAAYGIVPSVAGASVVVGGFSGGSLEAPSGTVTAQGETDVFVLDLDAAGAPARVQRFGGAAADIATVVAADSLGAPLIAGRFAGSGGFAYASLASAGETDAFWMTLPR